MPGAADAIVQKAQDLGLFAPVALKVREVTSDPDASLADLERVARLDPGLSGRLLKLANSPLYGQARSVRDLRSALRILGFDQTRNVALALALAHPSPEAEPWVAPLWAHAVAVGVHAQSLAREVPGLVPDELFVAGLLHDVGMALAIAVHRATYRELLDTYGIDGKGFVLAEKEALGCSHAEIGAAVAREWKLTIQVEDLIALHHAPLRPGSPAPLERSRAVLLAAEHVALHDVGVEELWKSDAAKLLRLERDALERALSRAHLSKQSLLDALGEAA